MQGSISATASGSSRARCGRRIACWSSRAPEALLCDPSYTQQELEELQDEVRDAKAERVHVLVTHADYDHVCGLAAFPEATVVAGEATTARIEDGAALAGLSAAATEWGIDWALDGLRVDRAVTPGEVQLGSFRVAVVDAPSHGREGVCFVLLDQGVLFPGDHLSPITIPLLGGSLEAAIQANRALLEALDDHDLRLGRPRPRTGADAGGGARDRRGGPCLPRAVEGRRRRGIGPAAGTRVGAAARVRGRAAAAGH